ncbi:MAG: aminotransferase class V-fold PLP-dependent enzyme [Synergistaceae bacterium]|nr:aminotransferase class V-fold PLP-dependent enzyme [Synergistaceae bacterium]
MDKYIIGLVPGPVSIPEEIRRAYLAEFGSADLEEEFFELYEKNERALQSILGTKNQIAIMSGEGMSVLWGALKSAAGRGSKLLCVANGLFSLGFGEMGADIGLNVKTLNFGLNGIPDFNKVRETALRYRPDIITAVHCETPSGTLTPLKELGEISKEAGAILIVDFVASGCGCPVDVDDNNIDIGLLGSQKVLSMPPHLSIATVSDRAWQRISEVNYAGYDALKPWKDGVQNRYLPYTHDWHAMSALGVSLDIIMREGIEKVYERHERAAKVCRDGVKALGFELFPQNELFCSPTVTAVNVPPNTDWKTLNDKLRSEGVVLGGNYGPLAGKVFRFGHMGAQAQEGLVISALEALKRVC